MSPRGKPTYTVSPSRAARSMCGPPGNGSPSTRATLSNASPAASSTVERRAGSTPLVTTSTSSRLEWPPLTSIATHGSGSAAPCSSWSTATCAGQVVDAVERLPRPSASALAAATPTSSAPASPGPQVTAIASTSRAGSRPSSQARSIVRDHRLQVRAARDLGHDAAEAGVLGRCSPPRPPAGCGRGRCRRRSRRWRSRYRGPGARRSPRHRARSGEAVSSGRRPSRWCEVLGRGGAGSFV